MVVSGELKIEIYGRSDSVPDWAAFDEWVRATYVGFNGATGQAMCEFVLEHDGQFAVWVDERVAHIVKDWFEKQGYITSES